jgi:succinate dehydrogenase flavin-adding protein (antitoxin of CptAB toxin-antitoxin module)
LNSFINNGYAGLSEEQCILFDELLDYPDQVLFDLLMDKAKSTDIKMSEMVDKIRASVQNY